MRVNAFEFVPGLLYAVEGEKSIVHDLQVGDVILLVHDDFFYIDEIDKSFIDPDVGEKYPDDVEEKDIAIGDSLYSLYDEMAREISIIPDNTVVTIFRRIKQ